MQSTHYPTMTQAGDAVVGWFWCVYVGQDVPDYLVRFPDPLV